MSSKSSVVWQVKSFPYDMPTHVCQNPTATGHSFSTTSTTISTKWLNNIGKNLYFTVKFKKRFTIIISSGKTGVDLAHLIGVVCNKMTRIKRSLMTPWWPLLIEWPVNHSFIMCYVTMTFNLERHFDGCPYLRKRLHNFSILLGSAPYRAFPRKNVLWGALLLDLKRPSRALSIVHSVISLLEEDEHKHTNVLPVSVLK